MDFFFLLKKEIKCFEQALTVLMKDTMVQNVHQSIELLRWSWHLTCETRSSFLVLYLISPLGIFALYNLFLKQINSNHM